MTAPLAAGPSTASNLVIIIVITDPAWYFPAAQHVRCVAPAPRWVSRGVRRRHLLQLGKQPDPHRRCVMSRGPLGMKQGGVL